MTDVTNPQYYSVGWSNGAEVIDIREHLIGNRSDAVKYLARAGRKEDSDELEDLEKALWYVEREVGRIRKKRNLPVKTKPLQVHHCPNLTPQGTTINYRNGHAECGGCNARVTTVLLEVGS